jgi:hypothetical protein
LLRSIQDSLDEAGLVVRIHIEQLLDHCHVFDQLTILTLDAIFAVKPIFEEFLLRVDFVQNWIRIIPLVSCKYADSTKLLKSLKELVQTRPEINIDFPTKFLVLIQIMSEIIDLHGQQGILDSHFLVANC